MKKLVLVMVFALLTAVFIAFNYLLWDRESRETELRKLQSSNVDNSSTINALGREIKNLEDENRKLKERADEKEAEKQLLQQDKVLLESQKAQLNQTLAEKVDLINILKNTVEPKVFEAPVKKWVEAVDGGQYEEAYKLLANHEDSQGKEVGIEEYSTRLKASVKSIKLKEWKLDDRAESEAEGMITVLAALEVNLAEGADPLKAGFTEGANQIAFQLVFDGSSKSFIISSMAPVTEE